MGLLNPQLPQESTELALAKFLSRETKGEAHQGTQLTYLLMKIEKTTMFCLF